MAIKIFSTSHLSSLPSQAVSLIRLNIFKRLSSHSFEYWTTVDGEIELEGSIRKISVLSKNRFFRYFIRLFWLWKIKPEVILFTGEPAELPFLFFRPGKSIAVLHQNGPMVYPISAYPYRTFKYNLLWRSIYLFLKKVKSVITISDYTARSLSSFKSKAKINVIYNGVDLRNFHPKLRDFSLLKQKFNINHDKPLVVNISSLIERKRPDLYANIAKACPEYLFVLVGSAQDEFGKRLSQNFPEIKNLVWFPEISREDLPLLLASADVFCFPSLFEGFGMVVAEAMASGCPVVTSSGSGPEELVSNDCGIIVQKQENSSKEIELFKTAIKSIIDNQQLREKMSQNARKTAEEKFDWDKLVLQWQAVLKKYVN